MNSLYIDTHSDIHIAIFCDGKVIREEKITDQVQNSKYLLNCIKNVIGNDSYDEIIVVNGPGSFTGVRLGVTIAKTLAFTQDISIKSINYLELMAIHYDREIKKVMLKDKNGSYLGIFNKDNKSISEYEYLSSEKFLLLSDSNDYEDTFKISFSILNDYMKEKSAENPHMINPIYIKKIEVEK